MEGALSRGLEARLDLRRGDTFRLDLGLAISPGQTVALLGPNGAGKSTVVAALAGLIALDRGRIVVGSAVLDDPEQGVFVPPEHRSIGVVFQDYLLFPHLDVLDNIGFGLRSRGAGRDESRARAAVWVETMGLRGLGHARPAQLSGGQAQRVALARALVTGPELLLLDEPLSALDVTTRTRLRRALADHLAAFAGPRLLITHDPDEAFLLADEVHVIESGRISQVGTADDIRLRPRTPYVADLAGSNLFVGTAANGTVTIGGHRLQVPERDLSGEVTVTIRPSSVSLYPALPEGSPRNTWETTIEEVELLGERARIGTGDPLRLTAEVTRLAADQLGLREGTKIWVSIKATEITTIASESEESP